MPPIDPYDEGRRRPEPDGVERGPFSALLERMFGVVESDIIPYGFQVTAGSAGGIGAVSHTSDHTGDYRRESQGSCDEQNASCASSSAAGKSVGHQQPET